MQIGVSAPTSGPLIRPDSLVRIATEAEQLGYDYVTVSDHIMIPTAIASKYPYTDSGNSPRVRRPTGWSSSRPRHSSRRSRRSCASSPR